MGHFTSRGPAGRLVPYVRGIAALLKCDDSSFGRVMQPLPGAHAAALRCPPPALANRSQAVGALQTHPSREATLCREGGRGGQRDSFLRQWEMSTSGAQGEVSA